MAASIGLVGWSIFRTWRKDPWLLPAPGKTIPLPAAEKPPSQTPKAVINTDAIVGRNLFDPERGAGATREAEENSRSFQRVRNLILLGTVIIGNNRTAIVQDGSAPPGQAATAQPSTPIRLKLGDDFEGFRLAEIADKKVVFAKNTARVEVLLDYFRKVDVSGQPPERPGQVAPPGAATPPARVLPNLPRRGRVPVPVNPAPQS